MQDDIQNSVDTLRKGGIILFPTDSIWALGCDATNMHAINKLFAIKQKTENRTMELLVHSIETMYRYADVPDIANQLIEFASKPTTLVLFNAQGVAPTLISDDTSIAIRVVKEPFVNELLKKIKFPLISTSANVYNKPFPSNYRDIDAVIIEQADYVVRYRQHDTTKCTHSSVISLKPNGEVKVIRE
ncbi:MAG: L-threonylcarbamoyladenylate synthase [Bacteroidales bacterium]